MLVLPNRPNAALPYNGLFQRKPDTHTFTRRAMTNLSFADQRLFERFGLGATVEVPHTAIHHAFEAQAAARPHATAAEHLGETITYGELNRQANRLAALLADQGVGNSDAVALYLRRSLPMLVGMLATLKVGAAYVPQDARISPESQLRHVTETTGATVILTLSEFEEQVPVPAGCTRIAIDRLMAEPFADEQEFQAPFQPQRPVERDDRSFILFTSGTTGNPNGVQVTHGNVCNILLTEPGNLGMGPGVRVGQILNIAFDMAAWETLGSLAHGATLVIRGKAFEPVIESVDVVIATPTILSRFDPDRCHNVKTVAVAGEPCPLPLAERWSAFCTFYNSCGPTETTIVNTMQPYEHGSGRLTIGAPTPNNTVYVLDEEMKPCAIGETGEMWAGGDCVTAGYLHNETLTAERYAPDPFLGGGRMMFRTRDLGRWTPEGELEHLGRTDDQVKIRGFRVELDSVSAVLEAQPRCRRAVTLKLNDRDLVGFVSGHGVDGEAARRAVAATLPYYAVPAFVLTLDELPMTSRGKIDKRTLLQLAQQHQAEQPQLREAA